MLPHPGLANESEGLLLSDWRMGAAFVEESERPWQALPAHKHGASTKSGFS